MTSVQKTIAFFATTDEKTRNAILDNIATHYGIERQDALDEVTRPGAHDLLDYITGPMQSATQLLMKRNGVA